MPGRAPIKKLFLYLVLLFTVVATVCATGEIVVRVFSPVRYMYPRYKFIPGYGFGLFENRRIVHGQPGHFKFHYSVNQLGYRGRPVPVSDHYTTTNIVVLGDSFSFGMGVKDGEDYSSVLQTRLGDEYRVINLATPGWGLTQHIRRYYELGRLYRPEAVILQYCANDPEDNFNHKVTIIENGRFVFINSRNTTNWVKKYLSNSIIQKSQLYNFYRGRVYEFFQNRFIESAARDHGATLAGTGGASPREVFYCQLLELFAEELTEEGVDLIMISVEGQLNTFPHIEDCVIRLHEEGRLRYLDLKSFFGDDRGDGFYSVEGHWGPRAHGLIAGALAATLRSEG